MKKELLYIVLLLILLFPLYSFGIDKDAFEKGKRLYSQKKYSESIDAFLDYTYENKKVDTTYIESCLDVAFFFQESEAYLIGINFLDKALECSRCSWKRAELYQELAKNYFLVGDFPNSLLNFERSKKLFLSKGDTFNISEIESSIGIIFQKQENYKEAIDYFKNALNQTNEEDDPLFIAQVYLYLADCYMNVNLHKESSQYFKKAIGLIEKSQDKCPKAFLSSIYIDYAEYMLKENRLSDCLKQLDHAQLCMGSSATSKRNEAKVLRLKGKAYSLLKKNEKSILYYRLASEKLEEAISIENLGIQVKLRTQYEMSKKEKKIALLEQKELHVQKQRLIERWLYLLIILVLGLTVLIVILKLKYNRNKAEVLNNENLFKEEENLRLIAENNLYVKKEELKKVELDRIKSDLEYKNKELAQYIFSFVSYSKLIEDLIKDLKTLLNEGLGVEHEKKIRLLIKSLKHTNNMDDEWKEFKVNFNKVYPYFFQKITRQFPNLTEEDLKLCAYLKISMTSKQIANVLNISIDGVSKRRNRLRKKLDVDSKASLLEIISNI